MDAQQQHDEIVSLRMKNRKIPSSGSKKRLEAALQQKELSSAPLSQSEDSGLKAMGRLTPDEVAEAKAHGF